MTIAGDIGPAELGHRLAQLRESIGLKQADLARQVTWSQAVLSRTEAGERTISDDELGALLDAIGTDGAAELATTLRRQWRRLKRPPLDHPDQDLLWRAEGLLSSLEALAETEGISKAFEHRLSEYQQEIEKLAGLLLRREHRLAFIGNIGIGKSTAICRAGRLEVPVQNGRPAPVLETGGGGVTLCEVHVRVGLGHGIVVVPRSHDEVRADVNDFVDQLLRPTETPRDGDDDATSAVPREIERAIRNMAGLSPRRTKDEQGKTVRFDPAKELAKSFPSHRELVVEVLTRMELHRRDRRELQFEPSMASDPLEWLKAAFAEINNGRHPDFSLPARIDLIVPDLMNVEDVKVSIIDTRGIDQLTARADLERHLEDPHTVAILCSGFNDAPSASVQHLLRRAREIRNEQIDTHCAVLVLPRPDEAMAVKDESGLLVESTFEGYELKGEQVSTALTAAFDIGAMPVAFFNAHEDEVDQFQDFLAGQVHRTRDEFRRRFSEVLSNADRLLENSHEEKVRFEQREAGKHVAAWIADNPTPVDVAGHVQDSLLAELGHAHASSIHAAVRREGEWMSLSYSHQLGHGARRLAVASLGEAVVSFNGLCRTLSISLPEASELLSQGGRVMSQAYEDLLRKLQISGSTLYREGFRRDPELWRELAAEWGQGSGYRERVRDRNRIWFEETARRNLERELLTILAREWAEVVARVSSIFETN